MSLIGSVRALQRIFPVKKMPFIGHFRTPTVQRLAAKYSSKIIASMPKRCALIVEAKGGRIRY